MATVRDGAIPLQRQGRASGLRSLPIQLIGLGNVIVGGAQKQAPSRAMQTKGCDGKGRGCGTQAESLTDGAERAILTMPV